LRCTREVRSAPAARALDEVQQAHAHEQSVRHLVRLRCCGYRKVDRDALAFVVKRTDCVVPDMSGRGTLLRDGAQSSAHQHATCRHSVLQRGTRARRRLLPRRHTGNPDATAAWWRVMPRRDMDRVTRRRRHDLNLGMNDNWRRYGGTTSGHDVHHQCGIFQKTHSFPQRRSSVSTRDYSKGQCVAKLRRKGSRPIACRSRGRDLPRFRTATPGRGDVRLRPWLFPGGSH
jgi:hypothetical protein